MLEKFLNLFQKRNIPQEMMEKEKSKSIKEEIEPLQYEYPPIQLLNSSSQNNNKIQAKNLTERAITLQKTLYSFGIRAKVENISVSANMIIYEIKLVEGVSINKVRKLKNDIALNLKEEIIGINSIPAKQVITIETLREDRQIAGLREMIENSEFNNSSSNLTVILGQDIFGKNKVIDLKQTSHILIGGSTNSGKSMFLHSVINSIFFKAHPEEVKLIVMDARGSELSVYNGVPHLLLPVITDRRMIGGVLSWLYQEMENRYKLIAQIGVKNIEEYNAMSNNDTKLTNLLLIIDGYAELIEFSEFPIEEYIYALTQRASKVGIYIILSTSNVTHNIINGTLKANFSTRIVFSLASQTDSKLLLDTAGAEKLLGKGDMIYKELGKTELKRYQGVYLSDEEVERIVDFVKSTGVVNYNEDILEEIDRANKSDKEIVEDAEDDDTDPFLMDAIETVIEVGQASTSFIQRKFLIGYARAGRIMDQMEARGIISEYEGSKPRKVLISKARWEELKKRKD